MAGLQTGNVGLRGLPTAPSSYDISIPEMPGLSRMQAVAGEHQRQQLAAEQESRAQEELKILKETSKLDNKAKRLELEAMKAESDSELKRLKLLEQAEDINEQRNEYNKQLLTQGYGTATSPYDMAGGIEDPYEGLPAEQIAIAETYNKYPELLALPKEMRDDAMSKIMVQEMAARDPAYIAKIENENRRIENEERRLDYEKDRIDIAKDRDAVDSLYKDAQTKAILQEIDKPDFDPEKDLHRITEGGTTFLINNDGEKIGWVEDANAGVEELNLADGLYNSPKIGPFYVKDGMLYKPTSTVEHGKGSGSSGSVWDNDTPPSSLPPQFHSSWSKASAETRKTLYGKYVKAGDQASSGTSEPSSGKRRQFKKVGGSFSTTKED